MIKSNFDSFFTDFEKDIKRAEKDQEKEAKKIVLFSYSEITRLSPADTGYFRANHFITFDKTTKATLEGKTAKNNIKGHYDSVPDDLISTYNKELSTKDLHKVRKIYIQNNLPYAEALEFGHSQQAPSGMYGITIEKTRNLLKRKI